MDTLQAPVPPGGVMLLNGRDLANWTTRDGKAAGWRVQSDGIVQVVPGTGDMMTRETMTDFQLHLEFRLPDMPAATGQAKANSGVFLQGRYEIQVLDSFGWKVPGMGDCGAIYNQVAPLVNACKPAMEWQTYDVSFRAPRQGEAGPRLTVFHNGRIILNNVQLPGVTGGAVDESIHAPGPLLLQDHGNLVAYRNIWVVELPLEGSRIYEPH